MKSKGIWGLVVIFLVLVGIAFFYTLRERRPQTKTPYASVEPDSVLRVEIRKGDTVCAFERRGDQWELVEPISYPADQAPVVNLVQKLTELELGEIISTNPGKFSRFQVDEESGVNVKAYASGNRPLISVVLGKMSSDWQHCYLRFPDRDEVYIGAGVSRYMADRRADDWRDRTILSFEKGRVVEIAYVYPDRKGFSLVREDGKWMLGKREADSTVVKPVLDLLSNFTADGFKDGAELEPQLTVVAKLENGTEETLLIGKEEEGKYLLQRQGAETVFLVNKSKIDRLMKQKKDFMG